MIIARAPFRIPLGGGGTDLPSYYSKYGGSLISVAIDKYVLATANRPIVDDLIRLKYSKSETVDKLDKLEHKLVREVLKLIGIDSSIELSWMADVPAGTGMGTSGSFLVATLRALHTLKKEEVTAKQLAEEACHIEMDLLKEPVGKQDQYMAAFGGVTQMEIDRRGNVEVIQPKVSVEFLRDLENSLLVFYTGITRSSGQILTKQNAATLVGNKEVINNLHFIKELGAEIVKTLEQGNIRRFGALLDAHWQHKRKLSQGVSNSSIDKWYQEARYAGAIGGKLMGAGGGGFLVFCCPGEKSELRQVMSKEGLREMFIHFDLEGAKVLLNF